MSKQRTIAVEGRATLARPSLCLLIALLAASLLLAASARADRLPEVLLKDTDPHSTEKEPVNWTTPLIKGEAEIGGGGTNVIRFGSGTRFVRAVDADDNEVTLYTDPDCATGTEIATGSMGELEGDGIEVVVPENQPTTFYAKQVDPEGLDEESNCSKSGLTYWESSTGVNPGEEPSGGGDPGDGAGASGGAGSSGPPSAPSLRMLPGRANDNAPRVVGSAPGAATVKVFSGTGCAGFPLASGSAEALSAGMTVHVDDNSVSTFTAVSVAGGKGSACSDPVTYVEDSLAPRTRITMGPGVKTRRRKAVFRFTDTTEDQTGASFFCKVDRGKWKPCHSPFKLRHLHFRRHTLRVRAIDLAGNAEAKAAKRRFKVIRSG